MSSPKKPIAKRKPYQSPQRHLQPQQAQPEPRPLLKPIKAAKPGQTGPPSSRPLPSRLRPPVASTTAPKAPTKLPVPLMIVGLFFATSISYTAAEAYNLYHSPPPTAEAMAQAEAANLIAVYDKTATEFDHEVESTEYWYGIMRLRRKMVKQARGDILESAAGTGRNTEFYIVQHIRSLTFVDASAPMLRICREKWNTAHPPASSSESAKTKDDLWAIKNIAFLVHDLESPTTLSPPNHPTKGPGYDTIIQTHGLCSTPHPTILLSSLSALLRPNGRILLLEHGASYYDWLNVLLTKSAPGHAARYGCWWNRDIGRICEESGLEVVEIRRPWWFLGTTWWVELRKPVAKPAREGGKTLHLGETKKSTLDIKTSSSP